MPETYNPRERTFIKKPEVKICVTCGQPIHENVKPLNTKMNVYVNDISGNKVTMMSEAEYIEVQGVRLRRSDVPVTQTATPTATSTKPNPPTK